MRLRAVAAATLLIMVSGCGGDAPGGGPDLPATDGARPGSPEATAPGSEPPTGDTGASPTGEPPGDDPAALVDGTRWTVDTVIAEGVASPVPSGPSGSAWLAFDRGRFIAGTGCGEVEGRVRVEGDRLRFSDVIHAIPVHCPDEFAQADRVMRELLDREATFAVAGDQLRLHHAGGIGLRLHADDPPTR